MCQDVPNEDNSHFEIDLGNQAVPVSANVEYNVWSDPIRMRECLMNIGETSPPCRFCDSVPVIKRFGSSRLFFTEQDNGLTANDVRFCAPGIYVLKKRTYMSIWNT